MKAVSLHLQYGLGNIGSQCMWALFMFPLWVYSQNPIQKWHCPEPGFEHADSCWVYDTPPQLLNPLAIELHLYNIREHGAYLFGPYISVVLRVDTNGHTFQYFIPNEARRPSDLLRIYDISISDLRFKPALLNGHKLESVYQLSICVNKIWLGSLFHSLPKTCSLPELYPFHSAKGIIYGIILYQFPYKENRDWIIYESSRSPFQSLPTPVSGDLWNENWTRPQMFR